MLEKIKTLDKESLEKTLAKVKVEEELTKERIAKAALQKELLRVKRDAKKRALED